jgi:hypothetical protein
MTRRGRKRKAGVPRTKSGRISRASEAQAEHRPGIEARMRLFGLSEKDARDQKAATVIGRLCLTREISQGQYDAAMAYLDLYDAYKRAIKAPDGLRNGTGAGGDVADTDAYAQWCRTTIARHDAAIRAVQRENAVLRHRGCNLVAALDYMIRRDQFFAHMLGDCRLALNALAQHFGLAQGREAA